MEKVGDFLKNICMFADFVVILWLFLQNNPIEN